ncbi:MAG: DNA-3-methyladenine glycosylase [Clostridium sp.]|nr:DNA-3-methyladenine glycosylase [Clostridium sp.]
MDYSSVIYKDNYVVLEGVKNFNIKQVVECGQCFRWKKVTDSNYIGVAYGRVIEVVQEGDKVQILNTTEEDFKNIWQDYFDFNRDYSEVKDKLIDDELLKKSMEFGYGVRVLNQEPFEILISFIISARNSIPVISKTINNISKKYGTKLQYKGEDYYTFPTIEQLSIATEDDIRETGASFRSKYIVDTVRRLKDGELSLEEIMALNDDECHTKLQEFKGVGAKVADCVMLFSMKKTSAFPVDVWVKRAMIYFYDAKDSSLNKIRIFARDRFGELSGFAQQYLFYYARENKIKL